MLSQPSTLEWNYIRAIDLNWSPSYSKLADVYAYIDINGKGKMRAIEWIKLRLLIIWKKIVLNWIFFRSRRYGQTANQPANIIDWFLYKKNWCANYKSQRVCVRSKFVRPLCAMPFNSSPIFSSWISFFITNDVSHGPNYLCVFFVQDIIFDRQNDESITHSIMTPLWVMTGVVNLFFCQKFASQLGHLDLIRCISLWLYKSNKLNLIAFSVNCILLSLFITVTCTLKQSKVCNAFLLCSRPQVSNCDLLCRALWEGTFVLFPIWIKYLVGFSWTVFFHPFCPFALLNGGNIYNLFPTNYQTIAP